MFIDWFDIVYQISKFIFKFKVIEVRLIIVFKRNLKI